MKDLDFENYKHPFSQRQVIFKKGIEIEGEKPNAAQHYLLEISQSLSASANTGSLFIVAYDVLENNSKFTKRLPLAMGLDFLDRNEYNLDKVAASLRVSRRLGKVFVVWGEDDHQHQDPDDLAHFSPHEANGMPP